VRTQLAAVLAKTGLNRQAELVALLSGKGLCDAAE
jgi:DNA-binding CsgD family transcriptional regulator